MLVYIGRVEETSYLYKGCPRSFRLWIL